MKRTEKIKTFGFFNVNNPSGMTSSTVVNKLKWLTGVPCGHMGTLDPLASGVLPVGVGNAARLFDYFLEKEKEYIAEFTFGVDSDTLDSTGNLVYGGRVPNESEICAVFPTLLGDIMQVPPKYSAKNVNGKRGYDLARAGVEFELYDLFDNDQMPYRLKEGLAPILDDYDYIIIDCPPSLGMLTINAFTASDGLVVPMQCEYYAFEGLSQLLQSVKGMKKRYNPELDITGILITMYNGRLLLSMQVISDLKKYFADKLFDTRISRNVKLTEAPGVSIILERSRSIVSPFHTIMLRYYIG